MSAPVGAKRPPRAGICFYSQPHSAGAGRHALLLIAVANDAAPIRPRSGLCRPSSSRVRATP